MTRAGPAWLAELQARFGAAIRTPLDRASGTLAATPSSYDARLVGDVRGGPQAPAADRLAVYNRQYWFRLFDVLQAAFPLTARLLGYWSFNDYAARFVLAEPPAGWDIDHVPDGFEPFLDRALECGDPNERQAIVEGARIDAAWREVFRAPKTTAFRPSAADASRLLDLRLVPSPAVAIVEEHSPLIDLRKKLRDDRGEGRVPPPPPLPAARWWALVRTDEGILQRPLEPHEAELLALLRTLGIRDALTELERRSAPDERPLLPAKVRAWLARSVELDFWIGIDGGQSQMTQL